MTSTWCHTAWAVPDITCGMVFGRYCSIGVVQVFRDEFLLVQYTRFTIKYCKVHHNTEIIFKDSELILKDESLSIVYVFRNWLKKYLLQSRTFFKVVMSLVQYIHLYTNKSQTLARLENITFFMRKFCL